MERYLVVGNHDVLGHAPGKRFDAELDPVQEMRLVVGGHLRKIESRKKSETENAESGEKE